MSAENFCLSWKEFERSASKTFQNLLHDTDFTDVTLACADDGQIKAHKVILSASSPLLSKILLSNPHQHPLLYLKGVLSKNLQSIIKFVYLGEVEVAQDNLQEFMETAEELQISGLWKKDSQTHKFNEATKEIDVCKEEVYPAAVPMVPAMTKDVTTTQQKYDYVQNEEGQFSCEHCNFDTELQETMNQHLSKHLSAKHNCYQCDKVFSQPHTLKRHVKTIHEGLRFPCDQCNHQATQANDLRTHKRKVHKEIEFTEFTGVNYLSLTENVQL